MHFKTILATLLGGLAATNAALVSIYSDQQCQNLIAERNVEDNSCAPTGGFSSWKVTGGGGSGQQITSWSANNCAPSGDQTACISANGNADCQFAVNGAGASNALSSGTCCGCVSRL